MRMATMLTTGGLCLLPRGDAVSRQEISTALNILIEFEAIEYSYSIRYSICIKQI